MVCIENHYWIHTWSWKLLHERKLIGMTPKNKLEPILNDKHNPLSQSEIMTSKTIWDDDETPWRNRSVDYQTKKDQLWSSRNKLTVTTRESNSRTNQLRFNKKPGQNHKSILIQKNSQLWLLDDQLWSKKTVRSGFSHPFDTLEHKLIWCQLRLLLKAKRVCEKQTNKKKTQVTSIFFSTFFLWLFSFK